MSRVFLITSVYSFPPLPFCKVILFCLWSYFVVPLAQLCFALSLAALGEASHPRTSTRPRPRCSTLTPLGFPLPVFPGGRPRACLAGTLPAWVWLMGKSCAEDFCSFPFNHTPVPVPGRKGSAGPAWGIRERCRRPPSGAPWWQVLLTCGACAVMQSCTFNTASSSVAPGVRAFSYVLVSFPQVSCKLCEASSLYTCYPWERSPQR